MASKTKILITGANGLLGRHTAVALASSHEVHAIVREKPADFIPGVIYHALDLGGTWSEKMLPSGIDTIFHLAQSAKFREFPDQAMDMFRVNVDSTARLLDYARHAGVNRFVYASSGGVYGAGMQAFHENAPFAPHGKLGYYLSTKLCSEILAENYAQIMTVVTLRIFFMYGRGQKRSMLIPRLVDSVREGKPVTLAGENGISINPIHVGDVVRVLEKTLSLKKSSTFNVAGTEILSLREIAEIIGEMVGVRPVFTNAEQVASLIADVSSMTQTLWVPQTSFHKGIAELL